MPQPDTDDPGVDSGVTSEEPDDGAEQPPVLVASAAPERSPLPRARPVVAPTALAQAESPATAEAAHAAGFTVIDRTQYAALTEAGPILPGSAASPDTLQAAPPPRPDDLVTEAPAEASAEAPAEAPADAQIAGAGDAPEQFDHDAQTVAGVTIDATGVTIPGLPPIATDTDTAQIAPVTAPVAAEPPPMTPLAPELSVDDSGRILWRDEELLLALDHEDPTSPVLAPTIVLTTSAGDDPAPAPTAAPMPEIVTRVSTSGGRLHAVELGAYASRFDAERVLLRLALSESATLGTGVRTIAARGGRFVARVQSLGQEEAEVACLRLNARDQPCTVVEPN